MTFDGSTGVNILAIGSTNPNAIIPITSSKAATGKIVSVTGPLVLNCLITIIVAAGAVAADIVAIIKLNDKRSFELNPIFVNGTKRYIAKKI